jgi:hypothetical protein
MFGLIASITIITIFLITAFLIVYIAAKDTRPREI